MIYAYFLRLSSCTSGIVVISRCDWSRFQSIAGFSSIWTWVALQESAKRRSRLARPATAERQRRRTGSQVLKGACLADAPELTRCSCIAPGPRGDGLYHFRRTRCLPGSSRLCGVFDGRRACCSGPAIRLAWPLVIFPGSPLVSGISSSQRSGNPGWSHTSLPFCMAR